MTTPNTCQPLYDDTGDMPALVRPQQTDCGDTHLLTGNPWLCGVNSGKNINIDDIEEKVLAVYSSPHSLVPFSLFFPSSLIHPFSGSHLFISLCLFSYPFCGTVYSWLSFFIFMCFLPLPTSAHWFLCFWFTLSSIFPFPSPYYPVLFFLSLSKLESVGNFYRKSLITSSYIIY